MEWEGAMEYNSVGREALSHNAPRIFRELIIIPLQGEYLLSNIQFSFDTLHILGYESEHMKIHIFELRKKE